MTPALTQFFAFLIIADFQPDGSAENRFSSEEAPKESDLPQGEAASGEHISSNVERPKYNSQELDKESGYYFYNARHYDPEIARFVTPDTVIDGEKKDENGQIITSDTQGWNRFSYVRNNPIIYKDPTGHKIYNVAVPGQPGSGNPMGHNLTLWVNDKTGEKVFYEVTGNKDKLYDPKTTVAHVRELKEKDFYKEYGNRVEEWKGKKPDELLKMKNDLTKSTKSGNYDVVEVKGVNEKDTVNYMKTLHKIYNEKTGYTYPYDLLGKKYNICTTFSYDAYSAGGVKIPQKNILNNPNKWPRDLNAAIREYNKEIDKKK